MKKLFIILVVAAIFVGCKSKKPETTHIKTDHFDITVSGDTSGSISIDGNSLITKDNKGDMDITITN